MAGLRAPLLLPVLALALGTLPALAQEPDCTEPQTQTDLNICAGLDFKAADAALNALWPEVRAYHRDLDANLSSDLKGAEAALLKAQRAWIDYRDGHCAASGFYARGGSMEPLLVASCKADLTRRRTEELRSLMEER